MNTVKSTSCATHQDYDFEWATKLNRLTLNFLGIWPGNVANRFLSNLRATFFLLVFIFVGAIPSIHTLIKTWGDMTVTIDHLQYTLPLLSATLKLIIIWWKKTDLTFVLNMISDDWSKPKRDEELGVMIRRMQYARVISLIGYSLIVVGMTLLIILPCFGKSLRYRTNTTDTVKILPLPIHYFYDQDRSPYFELIFAAQCLLFAIAGASYSGVDNLLGLLVFHLGGQMENLKVRLIRMRQFKTFKGGLTLVVKDHIRLINYFNIVESTFTVLLLALLVYFGILFCLHIFLIITILTEGREMSMVRLIYLSSIAVNICIHMCLYCLVGEILITQCEGIYHAAYNYEWYMLEPKEAKTLIIIMIRASKPLYITAGKIFPMTMSMFCSMIKTSGGYVSVLLAKQNAN